jgi:hypothetical protein
MAKRQAKANDGVQLFPFLAVLVCAMGALIFLLIVTTRMIRQKSVAAATAAAEAEKPSRILPSPELPPTPSQVPNRRPEPLTTPPAPQLPSLVIQPRKVADSEPKLAAVPKVEPQVVIDRSAVEELQVRIQQLRKRQQVLSEEAAARAAHLEKLTLLEQEAKTQLARLKDEQTDLVSQAKMLHQTGDQAEIELVNRQIAALESRITGLEKTPTSGASRFMVVPFDTQTGTTRRPIVIECTSRGLRFLPEDVTVTAGDLAGFRDKFNPLLAGAVALSRYWANPSRTRLPGEPSGEPYVLLLVRPSGTVAYYAATNLLSSMRQPFGYELIGEETQLHLPTVDEEARKICEAAVRGLIQEREAVAAAGGIGGPRSGGQFLVGGGEGELPGDPGNSPVPGNGSDTNATTRMIGSIDPRSAGRGEGGNVPESAPPGATGSNYGSFPPRGSGPRSTGGVAAAGPTRSPGTGQPPGSQGGQAGGEPGDPSQPGELESQIPPHIQNDPAAPKTGQGKRVEKSSPGFTDVPVAEESWRRVDRFGGQEHRRNSGGSQPMTNVDEEISRREKAIEESDQEFAKLLNSGEIGKKSHGPQEIKPEDVASPIQQLGESEESRRRARGMPTENLQRRRWGISEPSATIGMERPLNVVVTADRMVVDEKFLIRVGAGENKADTLRMLLLAVDELARDWGRPPRGFYWVPKIQFQVGPGGIQHYERLNPSINRAGLKTSREFILNAPAATKGDS